MYANWQGNFLDITKYIIPPEKTQQIVFREVERRKIAYLGKDTRSNRVYQINGKSVTLTTGGGGGASTGLYLFGCITPDRIHARQQNGRRFNEGRKFYTLTTRDIHGIFTDSYIRKLHPIECERLQTLPDNYTEGVSDTQRYKVLGNGWTVDVIVHLLRCCFK